MSYQALYRKYRPKDFSDVKGQDHIVQTLSNQIASDRVGHAYLFCGTRGTGKTTIAKIFAKAVNCENPGPNGPCGECEMCKAIEKQTSMNVIEMDAASNNGVDDVRQIIDEVQYSPAQGKKKVYIIDEVHMLSKSAFNAMLKTLEEPPGYLVFILATTEVHKLPITILSRCQRYDFKRISSETIVGRLRELLDKEGAQAEDRALEYIAKQADGAMRDGLSLLEQCISFFYGQKLTFENVLSVLGAVDQSIYHEMMGAILSQKANQVVELCAKVVEQGKDLVQFVNEFVWYLRNLLVVKSADDATGLVDMSQENINELERFSEEIETPMIFRFIRVLSDAANKMKYESNKRVMLEVTLIKLCKPQMEADYDSLVQRLYNIEKLNEKFQDAMENGSFVVSGEAPVAQAPKPEKVIRPEAVPDDVKDVVANWKTIYRRMDPIAQTVLDNAILSLTEAGKLRIVFDSETKVEFYTKLGDRQETNENMDNLVEVIGEVIGKTVDIELGVAKTIKEQGNVFNLENIINDVKIEETD